MTKAWSVVPRHGGLSTGYKTHRLAFHHCKKPVFSDPLYSKKRDLVNQGDGRAAAPSFPTALRKSGPMARVGSVERRA